MAPHHLTQHPQRNYHVNQLTFAISPSTVKPPPRPPIQLVSTCASLHLAMGCTPSKTREKRNAASFREHSSHHTEKMRRLATSGVMVVVDAANVEIEGQKLAWELAHGTAGSDRAWRMQYAHLLELIARRGDLKNGAKRTIVAAHIVSSERQLIHQRYAPGRKTWARLGITFTIPSSRSFVGRQSRDRRSYSPMSPRNFRTDDEGATVGEKAVDHTLVRIMTQEFEGLQLLHRDRETRPKRTFALVSGDFDYVDVVEQARLSGCDVEIWYWTERSSMSNQWVREESRRHDALGSLTFHDLRDHFQFLTASEEVGELLPGDKRERLSFSSEKSAEAAPPNVQISGATGRRRFLAGGKGHTSMTGGDASASPELAATPRNLTPLHSDLGADASVPSPFGSASSSRAPSLIGNVMQPEDDPSNERCSYREFCRQEGCVLRHTEAERRQFALHGGKGRYRMVKTKKCKGGKLCKANEKRMGVCPFLHEGEEPLCVKCLKVHEERACEVNRARPINPLEARQLVLDGYLVDLLVAKAGVPYTRGKQE